MWIIGDDGVPQSRKGWTSISAIAKRFFVLHLHIHVPNYTFEVTDRLCNTPCHSLAASLTLNLINATASPVPSANVSLSLLSLLANAFQCHVQLC